MYKGEVLTMVMACGAWLVVVIYNNIIVVSGHTRGRSVTEGLFWCNHRCYEL